MNKAKISEIFCSLQGEGPYLGTVHVFIRFFGCNLKCRYCDTRLTRFREYDFGSLKNVIHRLLHKSNANYISLTGGEPLLQTEFIYNFLKIAKLKKQCIYLETNGILYRNFKVLEKQIDIIALDIKLPTATGMGAFWEEHEKFLRICKGKNVFAKAIITLSTTAADIKKLIKLINSIDNQIPVIFQPNFSEISKELIQKIFRYQALAGRNLADVRVIPQVHKWLNIR